MVELEFIKIDKTELQEGMYYCIKLYTNDTYYKGKLICKRWLHFKTEKGTFLFSHFYDFYQMVSKKYQIQQNMERRAVNKILQTITGDEFFQW